MPKKKTGQRKKAEKLRLRQKEIRSGKETKPLTEWACNSNMVTIGLTMKPFESTDWSPSPSLNLNPYLTHSFA